MEFIDCPVCTETFNRSNRLPLVLICGHSICKTCTLDLIENRKSIMCPLDRKLDPRPLNQISSSYTILELIEHVSAMNNKLKFLALTPTERADIISQEANEKLEMIDSSTEKLEERIKEVEMIKKDINGEIDAAFGKIIYAVKERQNALKNEVNSLVDENVERYSMILGEMVDIKQRIEEKIDELNENSQNVVYELPAYVPDVPDQSLKLKFVEDSDKLLSLIRHYGRVRNMTTSVPFNCDHFTNITYWMVPPCCYQYYCCNKCHDKKESHSWTYANRMVCMFCEKEQDYRKLPNQCEFCSAKHTGVISRN
ncbi:hypothetical protein SteCoe_10241 [Stentor coeruleus]|uniref:RING-type domain-containing protein n=1 Tax=Stentor coeruleus TaxID=5963 RepID=A0A1R2CG49_9CILI|nr:hypothetical protein SteCoe_10241 [Stentor coeruleus]